MPLRRRLFLTITATVMAALVLALIAGGALVRRQLDTNQSADLGRELTVLAQPSLTAPATLASTQAALKREGITLITTTAARRRNLPARRRRRATSPTGEPGVGNHRAARDTGCCTPPGRPAARCWWPPAPPACRDRPGGRSFASSSGRR